jgi:bifunctional non-homologous end joining protein LigD
MAKKPTYVVQEHDSSHLHWDLRLEITVEGKQVLASWALPKGMPEEYGIKRLAIRTPDHAMEWAKFQGTIAEGSYGAGRVSIADNGWYLPISLGKEKMKFEIHGKKHSGIYLLQKMSGTGDKWLLQKLSELDSK